MKRIIAAWIEQLIEFDSEDEKYKFIQGLEDKKKQYVVICLDGLILRIRIQYNNNSMDVKEGESIEI